MTCGKRHHKTRTEAAAEAKNLAARGSMPMRVYRCDCGGGYCLTHTAARR